MPNKSEHTLFDAIYIALVIAVIILIPYGYSKNRGSFQTQKNTFLNLNSNMQSMWVKCPELISNDPEMINDLAKEFRLFCTEFAKFDQKMGRRDINIEQIINCKKMVSAASRFQNIFAKHPNFQQIKKNDKDFEYKFEALSQSIIEANQTIKDWEIDLEDQKNPPTLLVHH